MKAVACSLDNLRLLETFHPGFEAEKEKRSYTFVITCSYAENSLSCGF